MKPKIFVTQPIEESALKKLLTHLEVEVHPDVIQTITKESLLAGVPGKDYLLCRLGDQIDADVIAANPKLKLIATMAGSPPGSTLRPRRNSGSRSSGDTLIRSSREAASPTRPPT